MYYRCIVHSAWCMVRGAHANILQYVVIYLIWVFRGMLMYIRMHKCIKHIYGTYLCTVGSHVRMYIRT